MESRPAPYHTVSPGFEVVRTGEKADGPIEGPEGRLPCVQSADDSGNAIVKWSVWTWVFSDQWPKEGEEWADEEICCINRMQTELGPLSDEVRRIRAHIGSLVPCDNGVPVTIDELLMAIARGRLDEPSFHNGCWMGCMWWKSKTTQPRQAKSMQTIEDIVTGYLDGSSADELAEAFPHAAAFAFRVCEWLGPVGELTDVQRLMLERMLLPFEFFAKRNNDHAAVYENCFGKSGRGAEIDAEIARLAGLPEIAPNYLRVAHEKQAALSDPAKKELYKVCCHIAQGLHDLSDCHHSAFRWIEGWIYGIATGTLPDGGPHAIPTRTPGTERERLGKLLFGYALGLDRWLLEVPMQLLLLDLGHVDLGLDPKNEILRVYAYLGDERTPVKQWLAACLWHNLLYNSIAGNPGGLTGHRHKHLIEHAAKQGVSVRDWMDTVLADEA